MTAATPVLSTLTAEIVSAYLEKNATDHRAISTVIKRVYDALLTAQSRPTATERPGEPAVSVKTSVFPGHLVCLECGTTLTTLRRHLKAAHDLTPESYRARWQLPVTYPLVAPNYSKLRSSMAKRMRLGWRR